MAIFLYDNMNRIYKLAGSFQQKLKVYANNQVLAKLDDLASKANTLFKARHLWEQVALGSPDMYEQDQNASARAARALELVDTIYFAALNLKNEAKDGVTKEEIATKKTRLLDYCKRLLGTAAPKGAGSSDPNAYAYLDAVRAAAENVPELTVLGPSSAKPSQEFQTTPEVNVRPSQNLGEAFEDDTEQNMSEYDPDTYWTEGL